MPRFSNKDLERSADLAIGPIEFPTYEQAKAELIEDAIKAREHLLGVMDRNKVDELLEAFLYGESSVGTLKITRQMLTNADLK